MRKSSQAAPADVFPRDAVSPSVPLPGATKLTFAEAVKRLAKDKRRWEVRSAGQGSKGERWYVWA